MRNFNEWLAEKETKGADSPSYYSIGLSEKKSFFECLVANEKLLESKELLILSEGFHEIDKAMYKFVRESIASKDSSNINEAVEIVKKKAEEAIKKSSSFFNKGIELGKVLYTSVSNFLKKIGRVVEIVFEKVKKFLELSWKWVAKKAPEFIKQAKSFVTKDVHSTMVSALSTILDSASAKKEIERMPHDVKGAVEKIRGKKLNFDTSKAKDELSKKGKEIEALTSDEIENNLIDSIDFYESEKVIISLKGLVINEKLNLDEVETFLNEAEESSSSKRKSLFGWLIEAVGFVLAPFTKIVEFAYKAGTNGFLIVLSAINKGSIKDAYKYVAIGTIVSIVYYLMHALPDLDKHIAHIVNEAESIDKHSFNVKLEKPLLAIDDATKIFVSVLGATFTKAMSVFFPIISAILEIALICIASYEVAVSFCEIAGKKGTQACQVVMRTEHFVEKLFES